MAITKIPLVVSNSQRTVDAGTAYGASQDAFMRCVILSSSGNQFTREATHYAEKRPAIQSAATVASGSYGVFVYVGKALITKYTAFQNGTTTTIYQNSTAIGTIDNAKVIDMMEIENSTLSPNTSVLMIIPSNGSGAYYFPQDINVGVTTFTGTTTSGSAVVTSVSSTAGLFIGQLVTAAAGITAGTRIQSIDSGTQITLTANATASGSRTITKEHIGKIIDADFPSRQGPMVELDGYLFAVDDTGRIFNSDLNSITSWSASSYLTANATTGLFGGLIRIGPYIGAVSNTSIQFFYNAGNPSGSVLSRVSGSTVNYGANTVSETTYPQFVSYKDVVFFKGKPLGSGTTGVWMMDKGFSPQRISTQIVERIMSESGILSGGMSVFEFSGKTYLHLESSTTSTTSYLYCLETKEWIDPGFQLCLKIAGGHYDPAAVSLKSTSGIRYIWGTNSGVNGGEIAGTSYEDAGSDPYSMIIQTPRYVLNNGRGFFIKNATLIADNQDSGTTLLETSKDDYGSFVTMGSFDMTERKKSIYRLGRYDSDCAFRITNSDNTPWRGTHLVVEWEPATT